VVGAVTDAAGALARSALPRANEQALKTIKAGPKILEEVEDTYGQPGGLVTDAYRKFGSKVRESGAAEPFVPTAERLKVFTDLGGKVSPELKATLTALDQKGATVDTKAMVSELEALRDQFFKKPGTEGLTTSLREGRRHADDLIARIQAHPGLQQGAPLSQFETAKRALQDEGFLTGSKYLGADAASTDPTAQFFRRASSVVRRASEQGADATDPALGAAFKKLKEESQFAMLGEKSLKPAVRSEFASGDIGVVPEGHYMPQTAVKRGIYDYAMTHARPVLMKGNEALDIIRQGTPNNMDDLLRAATIEMLRQKERP
jgi:hypothetical protein